MIYEKYLVIGTGAVACNCAVSLKKRGLDVTFMESRIRGAMSSEGFCNRQGIEYQAVMGVRITSCILDSYTKPTLIVSAANRYIFPVEIVENPLYTIINYHGALLPKYPGRNAEAWAIFNKEDVAGITWHKVTADIDSGEILIQKSITLNESITSFKLLREYAKLATESFEETIDNVIDGTEKYQRQIGQRGEMCYSWMKPNDGMLDLNWDAKSISCFLRAMDYGPLQILGLPRIMINNALYQIIGYKILDGESEDSFDETHLSLSKSKNGKTFLLRLGTIQNNN
jgi:methionyl-tRNA formyltransferase